MFTDLGGILYFTDQTLYSILIQLANTLIMSFVLSKLLYKPVREFLQNRKERINTMIETTELKLKEAEDLKLQYYEKIKNIENERDSILENARKQGLEREKSIIEAAELEADVIKQRSLTKIEREKEKAKDEMKTQIIDISTLIASRFVKENITKEAQNKLFDEVLEDLGEVKWQI